MAKNSSLHEARKKVEDEFYTQLTDIEKELKHYKEHFNDKIVFCNCDDPEESNFWKYFYLNFKQLNLRKLISTHYDSDKPTYKLEYDGTNIKKTDLKQNGDFRSPECVEIMQISDIVVTNPPFSLFREYIAQLMECEKKFLIIGNQNNITYKEFFPLLQANKVWLGYHCGDMKFKVPDYYEPRATRFWIDETGQKWRSLGNICWYTNLDIQKRHEEIICYRQYNEEDYPHYDNYDGIEVNKVSNIPLNYTGWMGVPITFMHQYNPEQFEIKGLSRYLPDYEGMTEEFVTTYFEQGNKGQISPGHPDLCYYDSNGKAMVPYRRILIRRINHED